MQSRVWEENIRWPWWLTLLILGLDLSIIIAIWAGLGNPAALIAAGSTILFTCYLFFITVLRTRVEGEYLSVGRARIEKKYLGKVITLSIDEFRHLRGAGINPSAFHAASVRTGDQEIAIQEPLKADAAKPQSKESNGKSFLDQRFYAMS